MKYQNIRKYSLYSDNLNNIKGIKFTYREIDVIACIIHNRGEKKIATLLSVSPRTISTHVHNIMVKLNCGSRDQIIDFIEHSGTLSIIKQYYLLILNYVLFEQSLIKIGKSNNTPLNITLYYSSEEVDDKILKIFDELLFHLYLTNTKVNLIDSISNAANHKYGMHYILTNNTYNSFNINSIISLNELIDEERYFITVFAIISKIYDQSFDKCIDQSFNDKNFIQLSKKNIAVKHSNIVLNYFSFSKLLLISLLILFIILIITFINFSFFNTEDQSVDLPLPHENNLLNRLDILRTIDQKLNVSQGIHTVTLVGPGGSGKSIIARQYARSQKIPLIWEVNAETKNSLINSFEQLVFSLPNTEQEKYELKMLTQINDVLEKEKKLFIFLTKKIKHFKKWLIIYDNAKSFKSIQKYFPYDTKVWGNGKIIITTRDSNINFNNYIPVENVIPISELDKAEKFILFSKITNQNVKNNFINEDAANDFLEKIPSFPLDVSIAAFYIKEQKMSYDDYLKCISEQHKDFFAIQKLILNDIGHYNKTRYDIITTSLKHILQQNPIFADLLLLVCLLDSQNISKDLLLQYKSGTVVAEFMHEIRKFSLIIESQNAKNNNSNVFSIHHNTQAIILAYLTNNNLINNNQLKHITDILDKYLEYSLANSIKNNFSYDINNLIFHIENLLKSKLLLNKIYIINLQTKVGIYYFNSGKYYVAINHLNSAYKYSSKYFGRNNIKTAKILAHLGSVYRNIGDYKKAKNLLEKANHIYSLKSYSKTLEAAATMRCLGSVYRHIGNYESSKNLLLQALKIFESHYDKNHIETARTIAYLGSVYKNIGDYHNATKCLESASLIYKNYYSDDNIQIAWILARLSICYKSIGEYEKAKNFLDKALAIYQKYLGHNCIEVAWVLSHLCSIYNKLGDHTGAITIAKQSLTIYNDYYKEDHINIGWVLANIGNAYLYIGDYEKSGKSMNQAMQIFKKYYGENHVQTGKILNELGENLYVQNNFTDAEVYFQKSLSILSMYNHPSRFLVFENLTELYLRQSIKAYNKHDIVQAKILKEKALTYINQALDIVKKHFEKKSIYFDRIQSKIQKIYTIEN